MTHLCLNIFLPHTYMPVNPSDEVSSLLVSASSKKDWFDSKDLLLKNIQPEKNEDQLQNQNSNACLLILTHAFL